MTNDEGNPNARNPKSASPARVRSIGHSPFVLCHDLTNDRVLKMEWAGVPLAFGASRPCPFEDETPDHRMPKARATIPEILWLRRPLSLAPGFSPVLMAD